MFSIQKFFGRDPRFFELLEQMALEGQKSATALSGLLLNTSSPSALHDLREARQRSKQVHEELGELIVKTFVTALEREDIESLSNALYKIPKPIEKFAERMAISEPFAHASDFVSQAKIIEQATGRVVELVDQIRKGGNLEKVRNLNRFLQQAEAQADVLEVDLLRELYKKSNTEPLRIFIVKDLYDLLEKSIDRCRDVGNVVMNIVLKNS